MRLSKFARFARCRANGTMVSEPWMETHSHYRRPVLLGRQAAMKQVRGFCCCVLLLPFAIYPISRTQTFHSSDQPYGLSSEFILLLEIILESFHLGPITSHGEIGAYPAFMKLAWHVYDLITTVCVPVLDSQAAIWILRFAETR